MSNARTWSWRGHFVIVGLVVLVVGVLTALMATEVISLSSEGSGSFLELSHDDVFADFATILWASVGAFVLVSTGLLAAGLRKGIAAAVPYVLGLGSVPLVWTLLDKYI